MMGSALTLVTFDGKQYALPAYVMGYPWRVRERIFKGYLLNDQTYIPPIPFKRPPPLEDWGAAWWLDWNITTFLDMLDYMYDERNMTNIFTIPADFTETAFYSYLGIGFGATIFDATGHCGMSKKSEKVLNRTLINWISKPGLLGERYIPDQDIFNAWLAAPINWDRPQDEPMFGWYHPSWKPGNNWEAQAFDTGYCYTADCKNVYPPTGMSMISAGLVGVPKTSRNQDLAYEALMYAIVRNEAVQANVPIQTTSTGGVSPWLSSQSLPEFKKADRAWWASLVTHGVFAGYPSPQTYGFFETSYYDPLKLVTAEILYKALPDAVKRACKLINYATREPCTSAQWEVKLINDPVNNHDTVNYSWPIGIEDICRVDLAVTQQPLPALKNYLASTTISTSSNNGKGIMALCVFGIVLELALITTFIIYRSAPVIKAASFVPSLMIMFGAMLALISVMTRISTSSTPNWLQCFGTSAQGKLTSMSGFRLNMHILALNLINVILLLFYQFCIIDDSRIKATPMPNSSILLNQPDCPVIHPAASILLYAYNAAIVLLAGVFAYRTRNFISSFNENHFTVAAITLISVVSIIIVPVIQFINSAEATFMLIALGTFLASVLSTLVFAVPKLLIAMGRMQGEDIGSALKNNVKNKSSVKMMSSVNTKSILISKTQSVGTSEQSASFNAEMNTSEREGKTVNGKGHGSVVRSQV
ncbi:hypothetical protein HDV00_004810 [Rhizophlyctis rosea]|nr:hypothetical protein HDV00_004810 [Rhizophlyctis rosea]